MEYLVNINRLISLIRSLNQVINQSETLQVKTLFYAQVHFGIFVYIQISVVEMFKWMHISLDNVPFAYVDLIKKGEKMILMDFFNLFTCSVPF